MTKTQNSKILALLSCIFFFASPLLNAQERNEEVTIIAPYQPTIIEAFKINFSPAIQARRQHHLILNTMP